MAVSRADCGYKFDLILELAYAALHLLLRFQMISVVAFVLVVPVCIDLMQLKASITLLVCLRF